MYIVIMVCVMAIGLRLSEHWYETQSRGKGAFFYSPLCVVLFDSLSAACCASLLTNLHLQRNAAKYEEIIAQRKQVCVVCFDLLSYGHV